MSLARERGVPDTRHQALLYPVVGAEDSESRRMNAAAHILTAADMQRFGELYAPDELDWRAAPLVAASHENLPPALIVVAGQDPLHDDGVRYAVVLRDAGVAVDLVECPAMPHGYMNFPRFDRDAIKTLVLVVAAQRAALAPDPFCRVSPSCCPIVRTGVSPAPRWASGCPRRPVGDRRGRR